MLKLDYLILDPSSSEFNRGSFCYLPYLLYAALARSNTVQIVEGFRMEDMDSLPEATVTLCAVWSYPQLATAKALRWLYHKKPLFYIGYLPMLRENDLPAWPGQHNGRILEGMTRYHQHFDDFKHILLSDCDMHLRKYEGQVYPCCTSYGCPMGCSFCPSTVNQRERLVLGVSEAISVLDEYRLRGYTNIHFTDEDFLFDAERADKILHWCVGKGFNFIAMTSAVNLHRFLDKPWRGALLQDAGVRLLEVGFETGDDTLREAMHKPGSKGGLSLYETVAEECPVDIFWLTMTFFPGETLQTIEETGAFLAKHGHDPADLYGRVRTNSTLAGLGQFFQLYEGAGGLKEAQECGWTIDSTPVRLLPSYLPDSFLESRYEVVLSSIWNLLDWFAPYNLDVDGPGWLATMPQTGMVGGFVGRDPRKAVFVAVCTRLGVIRSVTA